MFKNLISLTLVLLGLAACQGGSNSDYGSGLWLQGKGTPGELAANVEDTVYFSFDSSTLSEEAKASLKKQAEWWVASPNKTTLVIEGHCDDRGTREYNLALGERRAHAARKFLVSHGVDNSKLETVSYGKERPAVIGNGDIVWEKNRRAVTVRSN